MEIQVHGTRTHDGQSARPRDFQHVVVELDPAQRNRRLVPVVQDNLSVRAVQDVAADLTVGQAAREAHIHARAKQIRQRRREDPCAQVVVVRARELLAFHDGDVQPAGSLLGHALQQEAACHSARSAAHNHHPAAIG